MSEVENCIFAGLLITILMVVAIRQYKRRSRMTAAEKDHEDAIMQQW